MKKKYIISWRKPLVQVLVAACALTGMGVTSSCNGDDIKEDAMYTFTGETVESFCKNTPELTMFHELMVRCNADALLQVYGHFTCFAPTNKAIETYLTEKNKKWDELTTEEIQKIVYNSTIRGGSFAYKSINFQAGALATPSLSDRYIVISFGRDDEDHKEIYVNSKSEIVSLDNEVHNGIVHVVNRVIEPSEETFENVLDGREEFKIWALAYKASGYAASMNDREDPDYSYPTDKYDMGGMMLSIPTKRKLSYTMFCEPDELLNQHGISGTTDEEILQSLENYATTYYGTEELGNYTSKKNPLNKFVAYHMLNRQMSTNSFIYNGATTAASYTNKRYEYYETMLEYRLIEIKAGNKINTEKNGDYVGIDETKSNIDVMNGFIHTLTDMMVYDEEVMTKDVLHKRIRFDVYAVPPQLTNNNIRWQLTTPPAGTSGYTITPDFCGEYLKFNEISKIVMWASDGWTNYQADELKVNGWYDFTVRMLPVPPGDYEIRLGYRAEFWRGISQLFVDDQISGIPVDLTMEGTDLRVGWVADESTSDDGVENDKMMRNMGYMKAPNSIYTPQNGGTTLRNMHQALRKIIGQYHFSEYGPHWFRAKNVESEDREFHFDYLEYIPIDLIKDEDRE